MLRAFRTIENFIGKNLTGRIGQLEAAVKDCDAEGCHTHSLQAGVTTDLLAAAHVVKRAAGQINVLIHAVAVMLLVPKIIEAGEKVQFVSLGAGNTGRRFDVETNRRVAEFKFIHWQGRDTIRQNSLFKDFYQLAEFPTEKRRELYVLDTTMPIKFLRGGRAIASVLSKDVKVLTEFRRRYGNEFATVGQYYAFRQNAVKLIDAAPLLPELAQVAAAQEAEDKAAAAL